MLLPLWFIEGIAEYYSKGGIDTETDLFLRDLVWNPDPSKGYEILPFAEANGRVSRLAASHVMVRGGMRPPILVAGDAPRLRDAVESAFRLETGPLVDLVREASGRALDVKIQALERRLV